MDPDEALKRLRAAIQTIHQEQESSDWEQLATYELGADLREAMETAVESFVALDGWLTNEGFLPDDWAGAPRPSGLGKDG